MHGYREPTMELHQTFAGISQWVRIPIQSAIIDSTEAFGTEKIMSYKFDITAIYLISEIGRDRSSYDRFTRTNIRWKYPLHFKGEAIPFFHRFQ
jgi:hypothetical protein